jgi:hypothetical protein
MEKTEENIELGVAMLTENWECLNGPPLSEVGWRGLAKALLDLAQDWKRAEWLLDKIRESADWRPQPNRDAPGVLPEVQAGRRAVGFGH